AYLSDFELFRSRFGPQSVFVNHLGSSELGPISRFYMNKWSQPAHDPLPVGYPAPGKEVLILDETGQPTPEGEVGEIALRSRFKYFGYWRKAELTEAVFRPDVEKSGETIYHTGDLGRRLPDGCLLHCGRKDFRVKIAGRGVDLVGLEQHLRAHPL